jgi:hypothetical protein
MAGVLDEIDNDALTPEDELAYGEIMIRAELRYRKRGNAADTSTSRGHSTEASLLSSPERSQQGAHAEPVSTEPKLYVSKEQMLEVKELCS